VVINRYTLTYVFSKYILILMHTSPSLVFAYYRTKFIFAKLITLKILTTIINQLFCCLYHPTYQKIFRVKVLCLTRGLYFVLYLLSCKWTVLSVLEKLWKAATSCIMSICLSGWNNLALTGRFFMKFDIWVFLKICQKNSSFIKTRHK